jgi:HEAT repeat protein
MVPTSRKAIPELTQALHDDDLWVRMNASVALARLGSNQDTRADLQPAIPELTKALKHKKNRTNLDKFSHTIQDEIILALSRATANTSAAPEAVAALLEALQDFRKDFADVVIKTEGGGRTSNADLKVTMQATKALIFIRTRIAFAHGFGELGSAAKPAVPVLVEMMKQEKISDFKIEAARALGQIGPDAKEALPTLEEMMKEKEQSQEFKDVAKEAIKQIEGKKVAQQ